MLVASAANAPVARRRVISIVVPSVLLVSSSSIVWAVVVPFSTRSLFSDTIKALLRIDDDGITVTGRRFDKKDIIIIPLLGFRRAKPLLLCVVFDDVNDVLLKVVVKVKLVAFVIMTTTMVSSSVVWVCVGPNFTARGCVIKGKGFPVSVSFDTLNLHTLNTLLFFFWKHTSFGDHFCLSLLTRRHY